jgi:glycolate oxidase iron-sulfur subunit
MTDRAPAPHTTFVPWFDAEDAPARRDVHTCIHCGLCLTACPTYRELKIEPDSPRGRLYLMRGLAEGRIAPSDPLLEHLDNCLGCRACETVCPAGVPYGRLLEETRGQLNRRAVRGTPLRLLGEWALRSLVPHRGRMHLAADLLRLGQHGPLGALVRGAAARGWLPRFAAQGLAMTPPLAPRGARALERVEPHLPAGARLERRPDALVFHPAAAPRMRVGFVTTCVMEVMYPDTNRETVRLLVLAGAEVHVPRAQTCCGALHAHAGLRRDAKALARRNAAAFGPELDAIVVHSAGCGAAMREYDHLLHGDADAATGTAFAARVRDVSEVLASLGLPAGAPLRSPRDPAKPLRVAYHDACHLAHGQKVRNEPRRLIASLAGVEAVELPHADWCCGSAGVYNLTHPDMANRQLAHKLEGIASAAPDVVVASNPGCLLHIQRGATSAKLDIELLHLVDLLARAHPPAAGARP